MTREVMCKMRFTKRPNEMRENGCRVYTKKKAPILPVINYRAMVAKFAWKTWRKLPIHTRSWVNIEDMVADGLVFLCEYDMRRYDASKSSLNTFMYHVIRRFYNEWYLDHYYVPYRCEAKVTAIGDVQVHYGLEGRPAELDTALVKAGAQLATSIEQDYCFATDTIVSVYKQGSPALQGEIVRWFLNQRPTKFHFHGVAFRCAVEEFRELANRLRLDIDDCRHVMQSQSCLEQLSRAIHPGVSVPAISWLSATIRPAIRLLGPRH